MGPPAGNDSGLTPNPAGGNKTDQGAIRKQGGDTKKGKPFKTKKP